MNVYYIYKNLYILYISFKCSPNQQNKFYKKKMKIQKYFILLDLYENIFIEYWGNPLGAPWHMILYIVSG
jgi:hypothetical protein